MKPQVVLAALLLLAPALRGQALTLEQAVQRALAQNYDVRLALNAATQAENDVAWGNAGFLPRVTIGGALN